MRNVAVLYGVVAVSVALLAGCTESRTGEIGAGGGEEIAPSASPPSPGERPGTVVPPPPAASPAAPGR